jgi:hypothetical protein
MHPRIFASIMLPVRYATTNGARPVLEDSTICQADRTGHLGDLQEEIEGNTIYIQIQFDPNKDVLITVWAVKRVTFL